MRRRRRLAPRRRRVRPLGARQPALRATWSPGFERADSWATDAHKWLNVPYDCGIVFCRHPEAHGDAMAVAAELPPARRSADSPSTGSRSRPGAHADSPSGPLSRSLGRNGVAELVDRCCDHAPPFAELLGAEPGVEILNDVVLNQVLVRFGDDDETTREVVRRVQDDGTCWLGGTDWQGRAAMRISVSSFRTTAEDVERSAAAILRTPPAAASSLVRLARGCAAAQAVARNRD